MRFADDDRQDRSMLSISSSGTAPEAISPDHFSGPGHYYG
jgi:hypothetical protein